jgi:hypothetical protein
MFGITRRRVGICIWGVIITIIFVVALSSIRTIDDDDSFSVTYIPTHYDILKISPNASDSEIKRGYRRQLLLYHPDKVQRLPASEREKAEESMLKIEQSYNFLLSYKRCTYDRVRFGTTIAQQNRCLDQAYAKAARELREREEQERRDEILEEELQKMEEMEQAARLQTEKPREKPREKPSDKQSEKGLVPYLLQQLVVSPWEGFCAFLAMTAYYVFSLRFDYLALSSAL